MHKSNSKIIYDLGANNGDDIAYYLKKADVVVALEANPVLCASIRERFATELAQGRLFLEGCVLAEERGQQVPFYVHRSDHGLSQFPRPSAEQSDQFEEVRLASITVQDLFAKYGHPFYVKVDLEGYDEEVLRRLFALGIFPDYVSVEAHSFSIFCLLVSVGGYSAFKLVDFDRLFRENRTFDIQALGGCEKYRFPLHYSSGPCADDLPGSWLNVDDFMLLLGLESPGWKDIHASRIDDTNRCSRPKLSTYVVRTVTGKIEGLLERLGLKKRKSYVFSKP